MDEELEEADPEHLSDQSAEAGAGGGGQECKALPILPPLY